MTTATPRRQEGHGAASTGTVRLTEPSRSAPLASSFEDRCQLGGVLTGVVGVRQVEAEFRA